MRKSSRDSRSSVARERSSPGARRARAASSIVAALLGASGCRESERPGFIADPDGQDAPRTLSGSFRAPSDGDAGAGGASSESASDGGTLGAAGSGAAGAAAGGGASGPATLQQIYEGSCDGSTVQWGFFTYEATTPGDSSIAFRMRTAPVEAGLAAAKYLDLLTASAALGTERCSFTGPAPCPVDVYAALDGAPLAHHPFAQIEVLLTPDGADGRLPTVEEWQLTFSCTFNQ